MLVPIEKKPSEDRHWDCSALPALAGLQGVQGGGARGGATCLQGAAVCHQCCWAADLCGDSAGGSGWERCRLKETNGNPSVCLFDCLSVHLQDITCRPSPWWRCTSWASTFSSLSPCRGTTSSRRCLPPPPAVPGPAPPSGRHLNCCLTRAQQAGDAALLQVTSCLPGSRCRNVFSVRPKYFETADRMTFDLKHGL